MMHEELWKQLITLDPASTAKRAQCKYLSGSGCYLVVLLACEYLVDPAGKKISPAAKGSNTKDADFIEQLCILAYLINARDIPITHKLVNPEGLQGGQFFFRGPHTLPTDKLEKAFGREPTLLYKAAENLNPEKCDYGDASVEILTLPRVPLYFIIRAGDDEFPANASILFDKTASAQLPLDALWAVVNLTTKAIMDVSLS